ncbi:hypothetical protein HK405_004939 [Cladochytrium tenue]|nr:hypothetical protein HK405_004939 [Cladochytrium tenue]
MRDGGSSSSSGSRSGTPAPSLLGDLVSGGGAAAGESLATAAAVPTAPRVTVALTEFVKELPRCRQLGIWGVAEVRRWIRERAGEANQFLTPQELLEVLPEPTEAERAAEDEADAAAADAAEAAAAAEAAELAAAPGSVQGQSAGSAWARMRRAGPARGFQAFARWGSRTPSATPPP